MHSFRPLFCLVIGLALCSSASATPFLVEEAPVSIKPEDAEGRKYQVNSSGFLRASAPDGTVLWERSLLEEFGAQIGSGAIHWGPRLSGGEVHLNVNRDQSAEQVEQVLSFDAKTGELLWSKSLQEVPALKEGEKSGKPTALRVIPAEFALQSGQAKVFDVVEVDKNGREVEFVDEPEWKLLPAGFADGDPRAEAPSSAEAAFDAYGKLDVPDGAKPRVFRVQAKAGKLTGESLARILPDLPYGVRAMDLPGTELPAWWIGARSAWGVAVTENKPEESALVVKPVAQGKIATVFLGSPSLSEYTVRADLSAATLAADGLAGQMGLINQRQLVWLDLGTKQLCAGNVLDKPLACLPLPEVEKGVHHLAIRVELDAADPGKALLKAGLWSDGQVPAPGDKWLLEVSLTVPESGLQGAPGMFHSMTTSGGPSLHSISVSR